MDIKRKGKKEINLIPLINIIFLLLTFFIIAGTIDKTDIISISLPQTKNYELKTSEPDQNIIYLAKDGTIAINSDIVHKNDLRTVINSLIIEKGYKAITIKSDKESNYKNLMEIIEIIKQTGIEEVSIATKIN